MSPVESLKTHSKFKKTEIGEIPVDWELVSIEDVAQIIGGSTPSTKEKSYWDGNIPWAVPLDITALRTNQISRTERTISEEGLKNSAATLLPVGSVLMTSRATIGECAVNAVPMATNQGFASLVCKSRIHNWYAFYLIKSIKTQLESMSGGSTFLEISKKTFRGIKIPLAPIKEQDKIAKILSTVDVAIEKIDTVIEKTKQLKTGLMQQLFTRGIRHAKFKKSKIGQIPNEWEVIRLGDIAKIRYGLGQPPQLDPEGVPMIRATNVKKGKISKEGLIRILKEAIPKNRNPYLAKGDIIVVRSGAYTGDIGLITEEWENSIAGYDLVVSLKEDHDSLFYANFLLSPSGQNFFSTQKDRSAQPHLNEAQLSNTPVPKLPLSEQRQISKIFEAVDQDIEIQQSHKNTLGQLKESLMSVLLTGKVRIKN